MKKLHLFIVFTIAILSFGCDYIDAPYIIQGPNGCNTPEPDFTPRTNPVRKVLIEDFTGHRCGNCPRAAESIHDIFVAYPNQVVAVGVHSAIPSEYTNPYPADTNLNPSLYYTHDFRREVSTIIDQRFGVSTSGLPTGMVNRKQVSGSYASNYTTWQTKVGQYLSAPPDADIQIKNFYNPSDSSLCAYVYVQFLQPISGDFKVVLYLVENKFVTWQKDYNETPEHVPDYEHNHILRESITSYWGTSLLDGTAEVNASYVNGYSIKIDPGKYNPDNCYVVGFLYDDNTSEIIQAEEEKVK